MTFELRDYQRRAVDSVYQYWHEGKGKNPIIVAGTGAGKSVIQAFFIKEAIERWSDTRILCLTHVKELIQQNHDRLKAVAPSIEAGIYSSGLKRRDTKPQVIFAGIQSIYKKVFDFEPFNVVIIDECFVGNTIIQTKSGEKMIKHITPSDLVACYDDSSGEIKYEKPLKLARNGIRYVESYQLDNGEQIECTSTHKIYSEGLWVQAKDLSVGQRVTTIDLHSNALIRLLRASVAVAKKLTQTLLKADL